MLADGEYMFDLPESEEDRIKLLTDLIPNKEFNIKLKDLRLSPLRMCFYPTFESNIYENNIFRSQGSVKWNVAS